MRNKDFVSLMAVNYELIASVKFAFFAVAVMIVICDNISNNLN